MTEKELVIRISGKADNSLNTVSSQVDKAFHKMTKAAKAAGVMGATALAGATTAAVNVGKDYEAQMSTVEAISGASVQQMERLEAKAQEMGATTKFTATESGQAMEYMAMAGWKADQMLGGIEGIMNLAAASGEDLASVSDIVTDALTAFNLTAEDSGHFADVLAQASSSSNTNVAMMGETFKYTAAVAGALGYSVEDTAVSIGLMANAGIKSSQAGTTLRKIMNETAGGIELVSKAYAKNGEKTGKMVIETANADGSMKDWSETVGRLREEFSKMTEQEQAANAESIGGKTAMAGLLSIVNASEKDYKKLTKEINNASGATQRMADIRLDNLEGDVTLFQSVLEGKGIELYNEIKEPLRDLVQDATDLLEDINVARVVDEFEDFGAAVLDFAEPLINVGEWLLENPEAISGVLTGIGGTITGYKLLETVPKLGNEIKMLMKATSASPYIAGGALAIGAIAGIATAVEVTETKLKNASLDEHFGDIAFSMEEIQNAADNIVGSKKVQSVGELFDSMDVSEDLLDDMDTLSNNIKKFDWKLSVGMELDEEDMDSYEKNVKDYVSKAQDYIDQEGYTISVATDVLFGDSAQGKNIMKDNNAFFVGLENKASGLSNKINKTLKKAMKDGLSVDLQEELNDLLGQMSEITNAISDAEAEASWETLAADFSGKEMDANSFSELQEEVNKNVEKISEGAKEALEQENKLLSIRKNAGDISESEYQAGIKENQKAYQKTKDEAAKKGLEFQYNTLMDTYGEEIASGDYASGDKKAIGEIIAPMLEQAKTLDSEIYGNLLDISVATTPGMQSGVLSAINGAFAKQEGQLNVYEVANTGAQQAANEYMENASFNEAAVQSGNLFFENILIHSAQESGQKAGDEVREALLKKLEAGITATMPINLSWNASGENNTSKGSKKGNNSTMLFPPLPGHASGTISTKQHIAAVSEGNKMEAIIPIDGSERSRRLYEATGKLMGASTSDNNITFAPNITVHVSGGVTQADGNKIGVAVAKEVEKAYRKMVQNDRRFKMR